jgi:hypothetical protein
MPRLTALKGTRPVNPGASGAAHPAFRLTAISERTLRHPGDCIPGALA